MEDKKGRSKENIILKSQRPNWCTTEMRNTTKLKTLLMKYTVSFDMGDDEIFKLILLDKQTNESHLLEGESYSIVLGKAYSYMLKKLKKIPGHRRPWLKPIPFDFQNKLKRKNGSKHVLTAADSGLCGSSGWQEVNWLKAGIIASKRSGSVWIIQANLNE